jgi:hypothetical protein
MRQTTPIEKILNSNFHTPIDQIIKTQIEQQQQLDRLQLQQLQPLIRQPASSSSHMCSSHAACCPSEARIWKNASASDSSNTCTTCAIKMDWFQKMLYLVIGSILGILIGTVIKRRK